MNILDYLEVIRESLVIVARPNPISKSSRYSASFTNCTPHEEDKVLKGFGATPEEAIKDFISKIERVKIEIFKMSFAGSSIPKKIYEVPYLEYEN